MSRKWRKLSKGRWINRDNGLVIVRNNGRSFGVFARALHPNINGCTPANRLIASFDTIGDAMAAELDQ